MILRAYDHKLSTETIWLVRVSNMFICTKLIQKSDINLLWPELFF